MRKIFFLAGLSALALTGCVSENEVDVQPQFNNAIAFENVVNKSTKNGLTVDLTNANLDRFLVYAYYTMEDNGTPQPIFENEAVTRTKNGEVWGPWGYLSHLRYWVPGAKYYFYAYSCGDIALNSEYGEPAISYTNADAATRMLRIENYVCCRDHQHDLIFAKNEGLVGKASVAGSEGNPGVGTTNETVKFQFQHLLSKVAATFNSDMPNDYEVVISNVTIESIQNRASYNPNNGWSIIETTDENPNPYPTAVDLSINPDKDVARPSYTAFGTDSEGNPTSTVMPAQEVVTGHAYLIPNEYTTNTPVQLKFTIELLKNGTNVMTRNLTGTFAPKWELGKTYIYAITVSGDSSGLEPIVFETVEDSAIAGWAPGTGTSQVDIVFTSTEGTPDNND